MNKDMQACLERNREYFAGRVHTTAGIKHGTLDVTLEAHDAVVKKGGEELARVSIDWPDTNETGAGAAEVMAQELCRIRIALVKALTGKTVIQ